LLLNNYSKIINNTNKKASKKAFFIMVSSFGANQNISLITLTKIKPTINRNTPRAKAIISKNTQFGVARSSLL
jgi:hypothetical protein